MAIFTRWGREVRVTENCGRAKCSHLPAPVELVRVLGAEPGDEPRYAFAHTLRADGGWEEIAEAIRRAPRFALQGAPLDRAFKEAE